MSIWRIIQAKNVTVAQKTTKSHQKPLLPSNVMLRPTSGGGG
jgi:hypothetical protein